MKDQILIDATFRIEDAWFVEKPCSYEVEIREPLRKAEIAIGFLIPETISVIVVLQQTGLVDWVIGKGYDQLWSYLRGLSRAVPWSPVQHSCSVSVRDSVGNVRIKIDLQGFGSDTIDQAQLEVKNEASKLCSGDVKETYSVKLGLRMGNINHKKT